MLLPFMASPATAAEPAKPLQASMRKEWLFAVALLAITLAAYYPAWQGKPVWDDDATSTQPQLRSFAGLWRIWTQPGATQQYYPLVHSVFWLEHRLWGDTTLGYHLLNILLHAFCALLLLKILRLLEIPGAWLAAALFALHPIEVESVAWISELKNTLSGAFYLGAALIYLRFDRSRERRLYFTALALFFPGLLCKTVIATLPAALLVVFWWKRGSLSWKRDAWPLVPFLALGGAMGILTAYVEKKYVIGVEGGELDFTLVQRFLIAGRVFWFYIGKLLWPAKLIFTYPHWNVSQGVWWQYLFPAAALALRPRSGCCASAHARRWPLCCSLAAPGSRAGVRECLSFRLFLRRRSFPISGGHRDHHAGLCRSGAGIRPIARRSAKGGAAFRRGDIAAAGRAHVAPIRVLRRCAHALHENNQAKPAVLDWRATISAIFLRKTER